MKTFFCPREFVTPTYFRHISIPLLTSPPDLFAGRKKTLSSSNFSTVEKQILTLPFSSGNFFVASQLRTGE